PPRPRARRTRRTPTRGLPAAPPLRTAPTTRPPRARPAIRSCSDHPLSRRLDACQRAELVVRDTALELCERLALATLLDPASDQPLDRRLELIARDAAEERCADLRRRPERATHEDVVRADAVAVCVLPRRCLEAEVSDPVLCARVRAPVEVQAQLGDVVAERRLEMLEQLAQARLRLTDGEVAVRLAGARDRVGPDLVRLEREADVRERGQGRVDVDDSGDDEVLLAGEPDVAAERLDDVGDGDQLVARGKAERYGKADVAATVLLRVHADVRGGMRNDR